MRTTRKHYRLVEITPGGVTGYHAPAARMHATHRALDEFLAALDRGGVVLDCRDAIEREPGLVPRSPYVEPYLEPGTIQGVHGLPRAALGQVARGFWGAAAGIMMDATPEWPFTGFDTVSLDLYVAFWRAHGARVGRRTGAGVVWDPPAALA